MIGEVGGVAAGTDALGVAAATKPTLGDDGERTDGVGGRTTGRALALAAGVVVVAGGVVAVEAEGDVVAGVVAVAVLVVEGELPVGVLAEVPVEEVVVGRVGREGVVVGKGVPLVGARPTTIGTPGRGVTGVILATVAGVLVAVPGVFVAVADVVAVGLVVGVFVTAGLAVGVFVTVELVGVVDGLEGEGVDDTDGKGVEETTFGKLDPVGCPGRMTIAPLERGVTGTGKALVTVLERGVTGTGKAPVTPLPATARTRSTLEAFGVALCPGSVGSGNVLLAT
ncbi:hypothetical protein [Deinococcus yavapaiensis]|uniref:hypothetical protein n=1 Tax=Deinococcus yavapaiensis TaxID=309889 RepID=UPI0011B7B0FA|nr:hypothetical protein [Deinococcus yavapaiensis]